MSINSQDTIANSGVKINQDKELYSFNLDTILLYNFANPAKKAKLLIYVQEMGQSVCL
ncbi:methyltransferase [Companilactobacillus farciminis]|nr:methyltransferase [Companilactobacillus farciminis]